MGEISTKSGVDIDILVDRQHLAQATELLREQGYRLVHPAMMRQASDLARPAQGIDLGEGRSPHADRPAYPPRGQPAAHPHDRPCLAPADGGSRSGNSPPDARSRRALCLSCGPRRFERLVSAQVDQRFLSLDPWLPARGARAALSPLAGARRRPRVRPGPATRRRALRDARGSQRPQAITASATGKRADCCARLCASSQGRPNPSSRPRGHSGPWRSITRNSCCFRVRRSNYRSSFARRVPP